MTRFVLPKLDRTWSAHQLGSLVAIKYGSALTAESRVNEGGVPVYGSGGIVGKHDVALSNFQSIIVGRKGSVGAVFLTDGPFWCIDTAYYLDELNEIVDVHYLIAYLRSLDLSRLAISVAVPGLNRKELEAVPIPLPTLPEQQRIVNVIQQANHVLALRDKFDDLIVRVKRQLFVEMFGDPNPEANRSWPSVKLGSYVTVATGGTPSREQADSFGGAVAWVKSTDLKDAPIQFTEENISELGVQRSNAKLHPKDTILLAMYGQGQTRGRTAKLLLNAACNQACAALLPSDELLPDYLWAWLQLSYSAVRSLGRGGQQENLNLDIVRGIKLPKPPVELQQQFARRLEQLLAVVSLSQESRRQSDELVATLQVEAFTGQATANWRDKHDVAISAAAALRDAQLRTTGKSLHKAVFEPKALPAKSSVLNFERAWLLAELSDFQHCVFEAFLAYPEEKQPLLAEDERAFTAFCNDELLTDRLTGTPYSPNTVRRTLGQLAALGLIAKITLLQRNQQTLRIEYLKAYRPLTEEERKVWYSDVLALRAEIVDVPKPLYFFDAVFNEESLAPGQEARHLLFLLDDMGIDQRGMLPESQRYVSVDELAQSIALVKGVSVDQVKVKEARA